MTQEDRLVQELFARAFDAGVAVMRAKVLAVLAGSHCEDSLFNEVRDITIQKWDEPLDSGQLS